MLLRHGEHLEQEPVLAGPMWISPSECKEARKPVTLREGGYAFDLAYTSVLKRAIRTLWMTLERWTSCGFRSQRTWRLNERHYSAAGPAGPNRGAVRRAAGETVASFVRCAAAALTGRPTLWATIGGGRDVAPKTCRGRVPEGHRRPVPALVA